MSVCLFPLWLLGWLLVGAVVGLVADRVARDKAFVYDRASWIAWVVFHSALGPLSVVIVAIDTIRRMAHRIEEAWPLEDRK